ncbi:MAG: hypothetical protein AB7J40_06350 [Candidatus Altimarinota bacterium]
MRAEKRPSRLRIERRANLVFDPILDRGGESHVGSEQEPQSSEGSWRNGYASEFPGHQVFQAGQASGEENGALISILQSRDQGTDLQGRHPAVQTQPSRQRLRSTICLRAEGQTIASSRSREERSSPQ